MKNKYIIDWSPVSYFYRKKKKRKEVRRIVRNDVYFNKYFKGSFEA